VGVGLLRFGLGVEPCMYSLAHPSRQAADRGDGACHREELPVAKADTVRAIFESYLTQNRENADRLLAEDFAFTSPQDDHIDKAAFFERCFPTADRFVSYELLYVVPTEGDDVFVMYEYELKTGERHRNVEVLSVRGDRITETQVFFGGRVG